MNEGSSTFKGPLLQTYIGNWMPKYSSQRPLNDLGTTTPLPAILVVDDNPSVLGMLHDALGLWGFDVFLAKNGHEGLNVLASHKVDGILLDMDMPVMNGLTMLDELRRLGYSLPVVMMSGGVKGSGGCQRGNDGAQGFMSKPFSLSFLRDVCETIFGNQAVDGYSRIGKES